MALRIGKNISSLGAQRKLSESSAALSKSAERLSSGLRINKASDDAAGLSVASSLQASSRIYVQGIRNLNDGLSLLNIAEGAVTQLGGIVTRVTELSEQAANGTYSTTQRQALNQEAQALGEEYNRIVATTTFNGVSLLSRPLEVRLQAGIGVEESLSINLGGALGSPIGSGDFNPAVVSSGAGQGDDVLLYDFNRDGNLDVLVRDAATIKIFNGNGNGTFQAPVSRTITATNYLTTSIANVNADTFPEIVSTVRISGNEGISILAGNSDGSFNSEIFTGVATNSTSLMAEVDLDSDGDLDIATYSSLNQFDIKVRIFFSNADSSLNAASIGGVYADYNGDGYRDEVLGSITGGASIVNVRLGNSNGSLRAPAAVSTGLAQTDVSYGDTNNDGFQDITVSNGTGFAIVLGNGDGTFRTARTYAAGAGLHSTTVADVNGDGVSDFVFSAGGNIGVMLQQALTGNNLSDLNLLTEASARDQLNRSATRFQNIMLEIGQIGSSQQRVAVALSAAASKRLQIDAAKSRIMDVDIAQEESTYLKNSILQKVTASILAQANQQSGLVLDLLRF